MFEVTRPFTFELRLQISSSTASTAQLFSDRGRGYNELDSIAIPIDAESPNQFEKLTFKLPGATIYSLRFDPITTEGTILVKNVKITAGSRDVLEIAPSQIVPLNQVRSITSGRNQAVIRTTEHADDPGVRFVLNQPVNFKGLLIRERAAALAIGNGVLIVLGILFRRKQEAIWKTLKAAFAKPHCRLQAMADQISVTDFIRFDAHALWFYLACFAVFLCTSMADLNGSSLGMYRIVHGQRPDNVFGTPRPVRSDEWAYHTPVIMNQSLRADQFALTHSALGEHSAALIGCVPVKHISTLFRPQFWAFFVLPVDYAYAVYWQMKAFILLCGVFTWLLLLTNSTFWSVAGALWYFFSPFTQWTYSWSSLLPESVGLICLVMVFSCFLIVGRNRIALTLSAFGLASCVINFALCAYLPHLIPLFWLASFYFVGWCVANRAAIWRKESRISRSAALAGAAVITGIVGALVYVDVKDAIVGIANTVYPGKRIYPGANTSPELLLSHFLDWTATERHLPAVLGSISEAAGFLWLAPVTVFFSARLDLSRQKRAALLSLWCIFLFILAWMLLPVPVGIAKLFALDRTGWTRCLPALGLANIAIVSLCATTCIRRATESAQTGAKIHWFTSENVLPIAGVFCLLLVILSQTNQVLGSFYKTREILLATSLTTLFVVLMLRRLTRALAFTLVLSQAAAFGSVNPWERGLKPITDTDAFQYFQTHREMLRHKWIYFADGVMAPGFLEAMGCDEYTGLHLLPDIDHFQIFRARGYNMAAVNSSGFFLAHAIDNRSPDYVKQTQIGVAEWYVSPTDPVLKQLGIEYAAFDRRPTPAIASGLIPVRDAPISNIWLYRLP
ncbi:MAG: hypothetical protein ACJ73N_00345 [Bryobacteraceae bacterium]